MISIRHTLVLFVALAALPSSAPSQEMDLVRDGQAVAVIVANAPAVPSQGRSKQAKGRGFVCSDSTAAGVLADWIEKMTEVRLPLRRPGPRRMDLRSMWERRRSRRV